MDDSGILALYFARDEQAVAETAEKYGGRCYAVSYQILRSREDAEECVNDTWLAAWNAMPPHRPARLSTFLGKLTRNLSFNRYKAQRADKRGGGQLPHQGAAGQGVQPLVAGAGHAGDLPLGRVLEQVAAADLGGRGGCGTAVQVQPGGDAHLLQQVLFGGQGAVVVQWRHAGTPFAAVSRAGGRRENVYVLNELHREAERVP